MDYNKSELLTLPAKEKIALAEALWSSVEEEVSPTNDEIAFAEERLALHESTKEGYNIEALKKYIHAKHGF